MDQVGGIQSAAADLPTTAERRQALAHIVSLVYRVLVPASPVILALGFGLYVPAVLSLYPEAASVSLRVAGFRNFDQVFAAEQVRPPT